LSSSWVPLDVDSMPLHQPLVFLLSISLMPCHWHCHLPLPSLYSSAWLRRHSVPTCATAHPGATIPYLFPLFHFLRPPPTLSSISTCHATATPESHLHHRDGPVAASLSHSGLVPTPPHRVRHEHAQLPLHMMRSCPERCTQPLHRAHAPRPWSRFPLLSMSRVPPRSITALSRPAGHPKPPSASATWAPHRWQL
jgi:hypothetical protein